MKVIKHGNIDRYKETKLTCSNEECGCVFSYLLADLSSGVTYDPNENSLITYKYISCPECNELIIVNDEAPAAASSVEE